MSWDWLAPRRFVRLDSGESIAKQPPKSRQCLPAIEQLDDRILLSAAPAAAVGGGLLPPPCFPATVNAVIGQPDANGQPGPSLLSLEVDTLKIASQSTADPNLKFDGAALTDAFAKMDELFWKMDESLITGGLTKVAVLKYDEALNDAFAKIELAAQSIDGGTTVTPTVSVDAATTGGGQLLPAVQRIESEARALEGTLDSLAPGVSGPILNQAVYSLLNFTFEDMENDVLKLAGTTDFGGPTTGASLNFLKYRIDEVVISAISRFTDPTTQQMCDGSVRQIDELLIGLLQPAPTSVTPVGGDTLT